MFRRSQKGPVADWWWTVDKVLLGAFVVLIVTGVMLSLAASPPVAHRFRLESLHFFSRHGLFAVLAILVMVGTSILSPERARRLAAGLFGVAVVLTTATLFIGLEVKGASRWIAMPGFSLQPSELLKPTFVVVIAWLFAEGLKRPNLPTKPIALALLGAAAALLVMQPDIGQTMLLMAAWGAVFFLAGVSWIWIAGMAGVGLGGLVLFYLTVPHVTDRINRFLDPESGDTFQVDRAIESFQNGGFFGQGPGEGTVKHVLPDAHTDFIFAVTAEEHGALVCALILLVYGFIVIRGLSRAFKEDDTFVRLAVSGLTILFGLQAAINMGVNLGIMPAKGMTLPLISYGGSSMLATAFSAGLILSLTRRRAARVVLKNGLDSFSRWRAAVQ